MNLNFGTLVGSFDTVAACDPRPAAMVGMTHLWLYYEDGFLAEHGAFRAGRLVEEEIVRALGGAYRTTDEGDVLGNTVRLHSAIGYRTPAEARAGMEGLGLRAAA